MTRTTRTKAGERKTTRRTTRSGDDAGGGYASRDCISVWPFDSAPPELRALSEHEGDEDWLAFVPASYADLYIDWLEAGSPFGRYRIDRYPHPSGGAVYVGAHS